MDLLKVKGFYLIWKKGYRTGKIPCGKFDLFTFQGINRNNDIIA